MTHNTNIYLIDMQLGTTDEVYKLYIIAKTCDAYHAACFRENLRKNLVVKIMQKISFIACRIWNCRKAFPCSSMLIFE